MPEIVNCPTCERQLRVPDDLIGKSVQCPECNGSFIAAAPSAAGARGGGRIVSRRGGEAAPRPRQAPRGDDDEDHPSRPVDNFDDRSSRSRVRAGWRSVRQGLHLFIIGIYVLLAALALFVLGLLVA